LIYEGVKNGQKDNRINNIFWQSYIWTYISLLKLEPNNFIYIFDNINIGVSDVLINKKIATLQSRRYRLIRRLNDKDTYIG